VASIQVVLEEDREDITEIEAPEAGDDWEAPIASIENVVRRRDYYPVLDAVIGEACTRVRLAGLFKDERRADIRRAWDPLDGEVEGVGVEPDSPAFFERLSERMDLNGNIGLPLFAHPQRSKQEAESKIHEFRKRFVEAMQADATALQSLLSGRGLSVTEVAQKVGAPRNTVLNWIKTGRLTAYRYGAKWMIKPEALETAMQLSKKKEEEK
jgi:excisionase family DNA binding protein